MSADGIDIAHCVSHLLDAGTIPVEKTSDRGVLRQWCEQLDPRAGLAHGEHRLADSLFLVDLLVGHGHPEGSGVEVDGFVEVGNSDSDVVYPQYPVLHANYGVTLRMDGHPRLR